MPGESNWENDDNYDYSYNQTDKSKKRGHLRIESPLPKPRKVVGKSGKGTV